jgi:hypothetical protein
VPWISGTSGSMRGVSNACLNGAPDFGSVPAEIVRDHLVATQARFGRISPGYLDAREKLQTGGTSTIDII